jgi:hypothetical protein
MIKSRMAKCPNQNRPAGTMDDAGKENRPLGIDQQE